MPHQASPPPALTPQHDEETPPGPHTLSLYRQPSTLKEEPRTPSHRSMTADSIPTSPQTTPQASMHYPDLYVRTPPSE